MFRHCVKFELIPVELFQRLLTAGPVEMNGRMPQRIRPVELEIVRATQAELTPVLSDLVEVHLLTGMRPSEVCCLRPCDIDRSGKIWIYTPPSHKTLRYGKGRSVFVGPKAQAVLMRYLLRDHAAFCFTPREAYEQHYERRRQNRKTKEGCGNCPRPRRHKNFQPKYNKDSYRKAVERAALRAFPIPNEVKADANNVAEWKAKHIWRPNQLRHTAGTIARQKFDLETAQILLGHSLKSTTEKHYAEVDMSRGIEFARKFG